MMGNWQLIITPGLSGLENMRTDIKLFRDFEAGIIPSTLRIYSWRPKCISLGYSQKIEEEIDTKKSWELGWDTVLRPTGGGIVFHNEAEVTYSLVTAINNPLLPKGLIPSYKRISEVIVYALSKIGINSEIRPSSIIHHPSSLCFSYPAEYEIVVDGKKIVGSAQKRGRRALLQQGSIFVGKTPTEAYSLLKKPFVEHKAISIEEVLGREVSFEELSCAMVKGFEEGLGINFGTSE